MKNAMLSLFKEMTGNKQRKTGKVTSENLGIKACDRDKNGVYTR